MNLPAVRWVDVPAPAPGSVILMAQAAYHVGELDPLRDELGRREVPAAVAVPEPPRRPLHRFRPAVRRHAELLAELEGRVGPPDELESPLRGAVAVVVMNDWGVATAPVVAAARELGVPSVGWVEGVQDFADVDTGRSRRAYRSVDHVMVLGPHGRRHLEGASVTEVGSQRLRNLWDAPAPDADRRRAVVNCNFTYGVLEGERRGWLRSVRGACRRVGLPYVVSQHRADRAVLDPRTRSRRPVGELLEHSSVLVSRFSTLGYEALVRGVELAYHNPHGERVDTFADPRGAFVHSRSDDELVDALRRPERSRSEVRASARAFLDDHLVLDGALPAVRAADVVDGIRRRTPG